MTYTAGNPHGYWRRDPESNRANRICNPTRTVCTTLEGAWNIGVWIRIQCLSRLFCLALSIFLPLALTACGGGSAPIQTGIEIGLYGDSTNVGIDGARCGFGGQNCSPVPTVPPLAYISVPKYFITNHAVGGLSAWELVSGKPSAGVLPYSNQMLSSNAAVVIVSIGIGDMSTSDPVTYRQSLQTLIDLSKPRKVILMTENPVYLAVSTTFANVVRDVAAANNLPLIDINQYLLGVIGTGNLLDYIPDGIHPNTATYALIGQFVNSELNKVLQ